jgi:hypothetical protein
MRSLARSDKGGQCHAKLAAHEVVPSRHADRTGETVQQQAVNRDHRDAAGIGERLAAHIHTVASTHQSKVHTRLQSRRRREFGREVAVLGRHERDVDSHAA